jgi:hypothetical protein
LDDDVENNMALETIRENIKISAKQSILLRNKTYNLWFDEECSETSHQRTQAKVQWLLDQNQTNGANLNNVRSEAKQAFREEEDWKKCKIKLMTLRKTVITKT